MAIYTVFFVTPGGSTPDFDLADFSSLPEACAGVFAMMRRLSTPCDAEIFVRGRRIGVIPATTSFPFALNRAHVAQSAAADAGPADFVGAVNADQAAMGLAAGMAIDDPEGLEMLAAELLTAGAGCEEAFGWTPAFYSNVAAQLRRMAVCGRN
ncbi:MAG: hypothetical protein ABIO39_05450 [Caulobacteraceae bacterium]